MRYLFIEYQSGKRFENFIERVEKQTMFQRKMVDFKGKKPGN